MREILPGVFHWSSPHPHIHKPVSSYWLVTAGVLIDPLLPAEGVEAFVEGPPGHIVLTNRHHYRDSRAFVERYDCVVWCSRPGMHEFGSEQEVQPFDFGDRLAGGITAIEIGALCPDETALLLPAHRAVALADGVIRDGDGPLSFVPDFLMGEDSETVKQGLRQAYSRLCDTGDFDHLLLAHGEPWIGGGREALREFANS